MTKLPLPDVPALMEQFEGNLDELWKFMAEAITDEEFSVVESIHVRLNALEDTLASYADVLGTDEDAMAQRTSLFVLRYLYEVARTRQPLLSLVEGDGFNETQMPLPLLDDEPSE
jgi:hypothetical protein